MVNNRALDDLKLDERTERAVDELEGMIVARYPTTTFTLTRSPDDPTSLHILAVSDVDDPDEVGDLVVERVVALQVDEGIPIHVIPMRAADRIAMATDVLTRNGGQRRSRTAQLWMESA